MNITKIAQDIIDAGEILKNPMSRNEDLVKAEVSMTDAVAEIEHFIDLKFIELHNAEANKEADTSYINRLVRVNCPEENKLLKIAKGYKRTLESQIWRNARGY